MHELSLVEELVSECRRLAAGRPVVEVWARCASGVDLEELSDGFSFVTRGAARHDSDGCLATAELKLERLPVQLRCGCGFEGQLSEDHMAGHMSICPGCGQVGEVETGLELVRLKCAEGTEPSPPPEGPTALSP